MNNQGLIKFTTSTKVYTEAGVVERDPNTLGFHFVNTGAVIVYINNLPIYPSGVFDTMYSGYKDVSKYSFKFDTTIPGSNTELTTITFNQSN